MSDAGGSKDGRPDPTEQHLDVYHTRTGRWSPEVGDIEIPDDWDLLMSGDAFVTREVKRAGPYWNAWHPRPRGKGHRRRIGIWAPTTNIEAARQKAAQTQAEREVRRAASTRARTKREVRYRDELQAAIVAFLDFAPKHSRLAQTIAEQAAQRSATVGSGRVGRTKTLTLIERAELAARAHIRHAHTDYHDRLDTMVEDQFVRGEAELADGWPEDEYRQSPQYQEARREARQDIDDFLRRHRRQPGWPAQRSDDGLGHPPGRSQ